MKQLKITIKIMLLLAIFITNSCSNENTQDNSSIKKDTANTQDNSSVKKDLVNTPDNFIIKIGTQNWMSKNLDVSTYRNGDAIPQVQDRSKWAHLKTGAWCYYENKTENGSTYGKLYNWYAVNDPRGLAPVGYHIPSDKEWTILTDYLGGENLAGTKMKSASAWFNNGNGSNESGFAGLPGGCRYYDGKFYYIQGYSYWWSSSEGYTDGAWNRALNYSGGNVHRDYYYKKSGLSVRCLVD